MPQETEERAHYYRSKELNKSKFKSLPVHPSTNRNTQKKKLNQERPHNTPRISKDPGQEDRGIKNPFANANVSHRKETSGGNSGPREAAGGTDVRSK